ncbi:MAG: hypothetical protein EOO01_12640 [Chitinophagaceae bacterium]|nr:MAG: hypothetical protein EOO01_12640 [Chitinophagaceae bacterium]
MELELSPTGIVRNAGVHDGTLSEVNVGIAAEIQNGSIRFNSEEGIKFLLLLEGISLFNISYLGTQNVINDLFILNALNAVEVVKQIVGLEENSFHTYKEVSDGIKSGALTLVKIVPSIGAEIACICKSAKIYVE